jgi:hypothetical protein
LLTEEWNLLLLLVVLTLVISSLIVTGLVISTLVIGALVISLVTTIGGLLIGTLVVGLLSGLLIRSLVIRLGGLLIGTILGGTVDGGSAGREGGLLGIVAGITLLVGETLRARVGVNLLGSHSVLGGLISDLRRLLTGSLLGGELLRLGIRSGLLRGYRD